MSVSAQAEETALNTHVTPLFPESQVDESKGYYELLLAPGQKETLQLKVGNSSSEPINVQVTPHTAYTNTLGNVEYGKDAEEADPTLIHSLDELMTPSEVITLSGKETKTIEIPLQMPKDAFEGYLAGGLRIAEVKEEEDSDAPEGEGVAIKNEFAHVIGVVVSNTSDSVEPELELLDVFADQLNYRNVISANLQNFTPTFVNRLEVEATVKRAGENDVLYEASKEMMQMAPNSNFNFPISLEGDRFRSGNYVLELTAKSGDNEWSWTREFTIDADDARKLNREDVMIDNSPNWWMIGALILLTLLVVILLYLALKKRRQEKD
ncbi:cell wall surface anchor family protein (plasmid) [Enterococcus mundtii QU 25]|nr:cell wall surface anchor family protein [Enterococcus mundtii QU 25]